jgi:hypothetical protein
MAMESKAALPFFKVFAKFMECKQARMKKLGKVSLDVKIPVIRVNTFSTDLLQLFWSK